MGEIGKKLWSRSQKIPYWFLKVRNQYQKILNQNWISYLVEPVQFESIEKLWFNIFWYKIPILHFWEISKYNHFLLHEHLAFRHLWCHRYLAFRHLWFHCLNDTKLSIFHWNWWKVEIMSVKPVEIWNYVWENDIKPSISYWHRWKIEIMSETEVNLIISGLFLFVDMKWLQIKKYWFTTVCISHGQTLAYRTSLGPSLQL
jgi:hypothetical protein